MCVRPLFLPKEKIYVQCGSCAACTVRRTREWSDRLLIHQTMMPEKSAIFATFTYDNEHLPENSSLDKKDCQLFFKRLRKYLHTYYPNKVKNLKYYLTGEYGPQTQRPHYHAIIFGLKVNDSFKYPIFEDDKGFIHVKAQKYQLVRTQELISKIWNLGQVDIDVFNEKTGSYVAGYVQKKVYGLKASREFYEKKGRIAPFSLMSKSIGRAYVLEHAVELKKKLEYSIRGVKRIIPRYFRKILGVSQEDMYEKIRCYIDDDFLRAKTVGVKINPDFLNEDYSSYEKKRLTDLYISQGFCHGDRVVSDDFLSFMKERYMLKKYEIENRRKEWRTKLDKAILMAR